MTSSRDSAQPKTTRPPPGEHWAPSLPSEDRAEYAAAWQAYRCCRDCQHWIVDDPDDEDGVCGDFQGGSFMVPEDFTCKDFMAKASRT